jgi:DNA polymerase-3 subunit epsilon
MTTNRIAAIDFETANSARNSACSIGLVLIQDGQIVTEYYSLIRPKELWFDPFNVRIHGITKDDVLDAPNFDQVWREIAPLLDRSTVIAHNASFDLSVLRHVLDDYQIEYPSLDYTCTCNIARRVWPDLPSFGLSSLSDFLKIELQHHHALEDARACAEIIRHALSHYRLTSVSELLAKINVGKGRLQPGGYLPAARTVKKKASHGKLAVAQC